jgi:hypothetical protein
MTIHITHIDNNLFFVVVNYFQIMFLHGWMSYPAQSILIQTARDKPIFQNHLYASLTCKRNIEMTPLCNIEVTLPWVLGSREVRRGGGVVDEQAGVQPS